jgi:hypothetical protein
MATPAFVAATLGLLLGDINGDGLVDNEDSHEIKLDRGQTTDSTNFREDVNTNGRIDRVTSSRQSATRHDAAAVN